MPSTIPFSRQQRITNTLLLNASFIDNLGLMHGKMGIAIYFFHLARETKNQIYEDYAGELIDEIYEEISTTTPLDFENGLAGIGWGIEYLAQNGFIEADTDEVLETIENQLQSSWNQFQGIGLLNGLTGLGAYYLKRVQNPSSTSKEKTSTLLNKKMLIHLIEELELMIEKEGIINLINCAETFNLTWDYPLLIAFLAEVYQLNLFNFRVGQMLQELVAPLLQTENISGQHSKRLQLALALKKLQQCKFDQLLDASTEELIQKLLSGLDRKNISIELTPGSSFLQNGTSGVAWLYKQLFQLTNNEKFKLEFEYWNKAYLEFDETNQGYAGFNVTKENEDNAFGLLNGIAGINLMQL